MSAGILSLGVGFLFAIGLGVSGMSNPDKVLGFLDVVGHWDPSLIFVMLGAIGVNAVLFPLILRRRHPLFAEKWYLPANAFADRRLIIGSLLFGVGWGMVGLCPGPAITDLAFGKGQVFAFVFAMAMGALVHKIFHGTKATPSDF